MILTRRTMALVHNSNNKFKYAQRHRGVPRRQVKKVVLSVRRCFLFDFTKQSIDQVRIPDQDRHFLKHGLETQTSLSNSIASTSEH